MDFFKALISTVIPKDFFIKSQKSENRKFWTFYLSTFASPVTQVFKTTVKCNLCNIFTK